MENKIKELLEHESIFLFGFCPLSKCRITKEYLLTNAGITNGSAVLFAIPYFSKASADPKRNISSYAVCKDYHAYTKGLFARLEKELTASFPQNKFAFFADHSPIDERDAAVKCGIGFFGKNHLLISEQYSSYMFIAEIITDAFLSPSKPSERDACFGCGRCISACPINADGATECLSAVTQKKGALTDGDISLMKKYNTFWGCDICQEVCPHTKQAIASGSIFSPIPYFSDDTTPRLTRSLIENMSNDDFSQRAYSWRGRQVLLRNLEHADDNTL